MIKWQYFQFHEKQQFDLFLPTLPYTPYFFSLLKFKSTKSKSIVRDLIVSLGSGLLRIPGKLVKTQTVVPNPGDSDSVGPGWAHESPFLTDSQVVLVLWICQPYLEEAPKTPGYFVNSAEIFIHSIIFVQ